MSLIPRPRLLAVLAPALLLVVALGLAWAARSAPLEPIWSQGLLRVDGLAALFAAATAALALADIIAGEERLWRLVMTSLLLVAAYFSTHLAALAALLLLAALAGGGWRLGALLPPFVAGVGLTLIALRAGSWRYPSPDAGMGLHSLAFALVLFSALGGVGVWALPLIRRGAAGLATPLPILGCLYALFRLFSLGPWNLGWMLAALLLGVAAAIWAARRALLAPNDARRWAGVYLLALPICGAGMSSGAGVALGGLSLLALVPLRLSLGASDPRRPWLAWLVSGAMPLTAPFVAAWAGVAGAIAAGQTLLAGLLWAAALLVAIAILQAPGDGEQNGAQRLMAAAGLSLAIGVGAPGLVALLIEPAVAQLQAGLTPFGELALWPWAGLFALSAARQPVAALPSLALAALMLILAALVWVALRLMERKP